MLGVLVSGVCIAPVAYAYFGPAGRILIIHFFQEVARVLSCFEKSFAGGNGFCHLVCEDILRHETKKGLKAVLCGPDIVPIIIVYRGIPTSLVTLTVYSG